MRILKETDTFKFACNNCRKCCLNIEKYNVTILTPYDIYRMSAELNIKPSDFLKRYCNLILGSKSRFPVVSLKSVNDNGIDKCIFYNNNLNEDRCLLVEKPYVCKIVPVGRMYKNKAVYYFIEDGMCGTEDCEYTLDKFINDKDFSDEYFLIFSKTIEQINKMISLKNLRQSNLIPIESKDMLFSLIRIALYTGFDINLDYKSQLSFNCNSLVEFIRVYTVHFGNIDENIKKDKALKTSKDYNKTLLYTLKSLKID